MIKKNMLKKCWVIQNLNLQLDNNITNLNENIFLNSYKKIDIIITDSKDDPNSINYE